MDGYGQNEPNRSKQIQTDPNRWNFKSTFKSSSVVSQNFKVTALTFVDLCGLRTSFNLLIAQYTPAPFRYRAQNEVEQAAILEPCQILSDFVRWVRWVRTKLKGVWVGTNFRLMTLGDRSVHSGKIHQSKASSPTTRAVGAICLLQS